MRLYDAAASLKCKNKDSERCGEQSGCSRVEKNMFLKRQWKYPGISAECPEKALRVSGQDQASAAILFGINTADVQLNSGGRGLAAEDISI